METKETKKKETTKKEVVKVDLLSALNQMNKSANVSKSIKNKYIYPDELKELKSTDKIKKSYRRKIQKTILFWLSVENPTQKDKEDFNSFCAMFINSFKSVDEISIDNLYSFHEAKQKEVANKTLNLYKQLK